MMNNGACHIYTDAPIFYFNKEIRVNGHPVIHSGNDGTGSGFDADYLDGVHNGNVTANYHRRDNQQKIDLSELNANIWYPCVIYARPNNNTSLRVTFTNALNGHKPAWATHSHGFSFQFDFEWIGGGWGAIDWYFRVYRHAVNFGGETCCYGLEQRNNRSALVMYLRGGGVYDYRTTDGSAFEIYTTSTNIGDTTYPEIVAPITTKLNDYFRVEDTSGRFGSSYVSTFANNAYRLNTTRTIWGQRFNGDDNVSGNLDLDRGYLMSSISGETLSVLDFHGDGSLALNYGLAAKGLPCTIYGNVGIGGVQSLISLAIGDKNTGLDHSSANTIQIMAGGINTGYWNTTEFYVAKNFYAMGQSNLATVVATGNITGKEIFSNGWLQTIGAQGWYNSTYKGGMYMWDANKVSVYNNKVLYNDGGRNWGIGGHRVGLKLHGAANIGINLTNNKYTWGIYSNDNGNMYIGRVNGDKEIEDTTGTYYHIFGAGQYRCEGNIVATGGITAKVPSDLRLKTNFDYNIDYCQRLLNLGKVVDFN